ncbi:MAG TPA: cyclase family protein [Thermoleophilaceae bacterium]|jgi:kynurenine formamidase|nr:cyclase family protein [Thermoleophilaceae bacterium]
MCLPGTVETVRESIEAERASAPSKGLTRRATFAGAGATALAALVPSGATAHPYSGWSKKRYQDLTHVFTAGFPVYVGNPPARSTLTTVEADGFYKQQWTFDEHSGTHMDAPGHFIVGGRRTPELEPHELFAAAAVIDISGRVAGDPDAEVEVDDLRRYERRHGRIPRGAIVFMYSGWEERVGDPVAYKNADAGGTYHFPGFGLEALEWLLRRREIRGIAVDTLSLDPGISSTFDVHRTLLGADRYGLENVANLRHIPPRGATVTVGVVPWEEGSGGPCRLLATY